MGNAKYCEKPPVIAAHQAPLPINQEDTNMTTKTSGSAHETIILEAVARGWCAPENVGKTVDVVLAIAIAREVTAALASSSYRPTTKTLPRMSIDAHIELTRAFERQRAVKITERVMTDFAERVTDGSPYWLGFDQACEEIIYRLKSEEWTLKGPPMTDLPEPPA